MTPRALIIVPTFNHGPTLARSVRSALLQTIQEVEVVVIGDGVDDQTREVATGLVRSDNRVRFLEHPKHESRAEPLRDSVVRAAKAPVICYLSDDDLYLPNHVERTISLLSKADFVNATPVHVDGEGNLDTRNLDLALPEHRRFIREVYNRIPLSCGAHTREAYLRLPHGWRTPPAGVPSDLFMWRQFLSDDRCRCASAHEPTVLVFPSPLRRGWSLDQRVSELERWQRRLESPEGYSGFLKDLLALKVREAAELDCACLVLNRELDSARTTALHVTEVSNRQARTLEETRANWARDQTHLEESLNRLALLGRRPEAAAIAIVSRLRALRNLARRLLGSSQTAKTVPDR